MRRTRLFRTGWVIFTLSTFQTRLPHSQLVMYRFLIWGFRLGGVRLGCRCMVMLFMLLMDKLVFTMSMCQTQRIPRCQRLLAPGLRSLV